MNSPRKLTPQEEARLAQVRKNFQEKKQISDSLKSIKKKIGVYSGKGGVGKTTVATNLSLKIAEKNLSVALFDCDIDCPNVTKTIKISEPPTERNNKLIPPMIHNAINQFISSTEWGELDYMLVDLPPGTSDAPLTVMQTLQLDGFIIVTTPQDLAALDAKRSINMIRKLNLEVLGIIENMSGDIFGVGTGEDLSSELNIPFLGSLELSGEYKNSKSAVIKNSKKVNEEYEKIVDNLYKLIN